MCSSFRVFKFYANRASRDKLGPAGIGGALQNDKGDILGMFSKGVRINCSNEAKVLDILEALWLFSPRFKTLDCEK